MPENKRTYVDGILHGAYELYFPTGELKQKGLFIDGRKHGRWVTYIQVAGKIKISSDGVFVNGVKYGPWKMFVGKDSEAQIVNFWNGNEETLSAMPVLSKSTSKKTRKKK